MLVAFDIILNYYTKHIQNIYKTYIQSFIYFLVDLVHLYTSYSLRFSHSLSCIYMLDRTV